MEVAGNQARVNRLYLTALAQNLVKRQLSFLKPNLSPLLNFLLYPSLILLLPILSHLQFSLRLLSTRLQLSLLQLLELLLVLIPQFSNLVLDLLNLVQHRPLIRHLLLLTVLEHV